MTMPLAALPRATHSAGFPFAPRLSRANCTTTCERAGLLHQTSPVRLNAVCGNQIPTSYKVQVDPVSLQRLITWSDAMCPYRGDEEIRAIDDAEF